MLGPAPSCIMSLRKHSGRSAQQQVSLDHGPAAFSEFSSSEGLHVGLSSGSGPCLRLRRGWGRGGREQGDQEQGTPEEAAVEQHPMASLFGLQEGLWRLLWKQDSGDRNKGWLREAITPLLLGCHGMNGNEFLEPGRAASPRTPLACGAHSLDISEPLCPYL